MEYKKLFRSTLTPSLIVDVDSPKFTILDVTYSYLQATFTTFDIIGKGLFEVFPDNPSDIESQGVRNLTRSLNSVISNRREDKMDIQKYDVMKDDKFTIKYWSPINIPILNDTGKVEAIMHSVIDVSDLIVISDNKKDIEKLLDITMKLNKSYYDKIRGIN